MGTSTGSTAAGSLRNRLCYPINATALICTQTGMPGVHARNDSDATHQCNHLQDFPARRAVLVIGVDEESIVRASKRSKFADIAAEAPLEGVLSLFRREPIR